MSYFEPPILDEKWMEWRVRMNHYEQQRRINQRRRIRMSTLEDDKEDYVKGLISQEQLENRVELRWEIEHG